MILLPLLTGCIGLKHLKDDEKLLYQQRIHASAEVDEEKLKDLYSQNANRKMLKLPISPLVGIYYWGFKNYDQDKYIQKRDSLIKKFDRKIARASSQKKINNLQFRKQKKVDRLTKIIEEGNLRMQWGEKISVYDSSNVQLTKERFHDYLFSKGYFNNVISSREMTLGKFVTIIYQVDPKPAYFIDSIFYQVKDTTILNLIKTHSTESLIKKGDKYDQDKFTGERERIDLLLKDYGYYDFSRQYIEFKADTAMLGNRKIISLFIINDPAQRGYHKQFKIDSVIFTTDAGAKAIGSTRKTRSYRGIDYKSYNKKNYNLKILTQRVFVTPGNLYSRSKTINTQQQLSNLDAFKFVNINYDTTGGKFKANIYTSPLDRYQWSNEAGVNVTQGFPGPFDNISFKKRNVFNGLETFDLTGRFGFEGVAAATNDQSIYTSTEAGINASLTFPQFLWPFREKTLFKLGRYNPKTKVSSGYAYTDRPEYRRTTTSVAFNYNWQNARTRRYDFTIANLNIINSQVSEGFQAVLDTLEKKGNNLFRSFSPSFVSSMIFGMTWNVNNYGNSDKNSVFFRWQIESGGTFLNFFNYPLIEDNNLQTYRYLRFNADLRKNVVIDKNTTLAYRLNTGIAYSYDSIKALPYEKYFFVGGSNSVRAWRPRRLGQGSLKPELNQGDKTTSDGYFNYNFEKPGDILIEASIELRRHIVGFIEGALFIDVGNTWTIDPIKSLNTTNAGNSQFTLDSFYKQFGVGTGFGLRFDFTFLIIRLDIGMKVYDPARDGNEKFVLDKARFYRPYATKDSEGNYTNFREPVIYNFGIGYPF